MGKIDTSGWKEFHMTDIGFKVYHGSRITKAERVEGDTVFLTAGFENCGVVGTIGNENIDVWEKPITVDMFGNVFYHDEACAGDDNIYAFLNSKLSKAAKLFVASAVASVTQSKYSYQQQFRQGDANKLSVYLPCTHDGDPDWAYMESYMANLETKVAESLTLLQAAKDAEKKKVDTREWEEFRVGDLFDIHPTKAYKCTNAELLDNGETHVVVNSAYNNGVGGLSTLKPTEQGNMITFSDTVDANTIFYQDKPFIGYPHVQGLYPIGIFRKNWTELSLKYFATVFRQKALSIGFDYGNKFRRDIAVKLYIFLPVDKTGQPDWVYMEEHMRKVEERVKATIGELKVSLPTK